MTSSMLRPTAGLVAAVLIGVSGIHQAAHAQPSIAVSAETAAEPAAEPVPAFDNAFMSNAANVKIGEGVWHEQCRHCHGNSAYPGKAPKLNPGNLAPEVIFDRVTNGFRKMPAWKAVFSLEQRKGVVAYIKSDSFSP